MKRSLFVVLMVIAMLLMAVPASAGPPVDVAGEWNYEGEFWPVKVAGPNLFVEGTDTGHWTGGLVGTTQEEFTAVFHRDHAIYRGHMEFTGSVDGVYGTMMIKTNGILKDGIWTGNWVIQHGTGDLASVHGGGTFVGPPLFLDYEGRIHFSG